MDMTFIIIMKFIILGLFMFLVRNHIKTKILKNILLIVISLLTIWTLIFSIDIKQTNSFKEPVFARENGNMGSMIRYDGLGYKIGLEKDAKTGHILYSQMTIFGQLVAGGVVDFTD